MKTYWLENMTEEEAIAAAELIMKTIDAACELIAAEEGFEEKGIEFIEDEEGCEEE